MYFLVKEIEFIIWYNYLIYFKLIYLMYFYIVRNNGMLEGLRVKTNFLLIYRQNELSG